MPNWWQEVALEVLADKNWRKHYGIQKMKLWAQYRPWQKMKLDCANIAGGKK